MDCTDAESEPEKQNDDSPEKGKLLQNCIKENGICNGSSETNLKIPLTVLDDSGIGSSLSQLKHEAGLKNGSSGGEPTNIQSQRDNVNYQLQEAGKLTNTSGHGKGSEQTYRKQCSPENFFETPPNSLLCNIPFSVLEAAESIRDENPVERNTAAEISNPEEENVSDSTLVTSASQSSSDPNGANGDIPLEGKALAETTDNRNGELNDDKYYPPIPVEDWTPDKKVRKDKDLCSSSENADCFNEGRCLPPDQWTPVKAPKQQTSDVEQSSNAADTAVKVSQMTIARRSSERKKYTFEEVVQIVEEKIQNLLMKVDFCVSETRADLKFIQRQTRYSSDVILNRRVVDRIVKMGIAHVFLKVWQSVSNVDYMKADNLIAFKNLQAALSIIWNCTDKSPALCDSLVRCGVIQLLMTELASNRLRTGDLSNENLIYLLKAYLGVLHNMARLCPESRKIFRSSNAVEVLKMYLGLEQGLVKTKAYLILSYIVTEEENDVINATHDLLNYIIGILREALSSENHYAKTTAFWASEIADGLNHLAVNDANKIRMGQLGVIQLYLKLLQSDSVEEQGLGTAGIWILAFCDENKYLINRIQGCIEALNAIANNSPHESIRRSAHGAIWVIKKAPERPTTQQVQSADIPHVMISYQWSSQRIMVKIKNKLKAAGYKVWMDIDNMSGSTLQAMALAVERAAVVLVCMSQVYKDSASCRTEAEYTYSQRKDIIPLLLQQGYVPDGWLGALVGTRIYFDLTHEELLNIQVDKLIKEIGARGKMPSNQNLAVSCEPERGDRGSSMCSDLSLSSSTSSLHSYVRLPAASTWGPTEVKQWLTSHQLGHVANRFEGFTGELLLQYKTMMKAAPEYFYSSLDTKLKFDLVTSLKFAKALDKLAGNT